MMGSSGSRQDLSDRIAAVRDRFSGDLGIAAKNIATGEEVMIDADRAFPTASTFKISVMIEVFRNAEQGILRLDDRFTLQANDVVKGSGIVRALTPGCTLTIQDLATLMIIVSDNTATNMLIDRVGGVESINQTMQKKLVCLRS